MLEKIFICEPKFTLMSLVLFCDRLHADLKDSLAVYPSGLTPSGDFPSFPAPDLSAVLTLVFSAMKDLRLYLAANPFVNKASETEFFKTIKPKFTAELLFYCEFHQLCNAFQTGSQVQELPFLSAELERISAIFTIESELYRYVKGGFTYLDELWFSMGRIDCPGDWIGELSCVNRDTDFSSSKDHKVAAFIAHERLCRLIETRLSALKSSGEPGLPHLKIPWTAGIMDLIELVYGAYLNKAFDHGRMSLVDICTVLEQVFDVKLDNHSYLFSQTMRFRKTESLKFLPDMIRAIEAKFDELDVKGKVRRNRTQP
jgi:hypothetical protein